MLLIALVGLALSSACAFSGGGGSDETSIMEIQGDGRRSPLEGDVVTTDGVVTAVRRNRRGFWLQDSAGDGDPSTSDALQVFSSPWPADVPFPRPGERVRVTGTVEEFSREPDLSLTQIGGPLTLELLGEADLPPPRALPALPEESVAEAIAFWTPLESMSVSFDRSVVVGPTSRFGELVVLLDANRAGDEARLFVRPLGGDRVDYNPERVLLDDAVHDPFEARAGDEVREVEGVVDYSFGNYKIQPVALTHVPRSSADQPTPGSVDGVRVTTWNLENLFDLEDDPGVDDQSSTPSALELSGKLELLTAAIVDTLLLPEILVVQEVENERVLERLGAAVNARAGTSYRARGLGSSDGRGIENAFLYDEDRAQLVEARLLSSPDVDRAFGPESPSPGREPLVGRFRVGASSLLVVGNHFKSKSGDDPLFGVRQPPVRLTELQRKDQARAVRRFVDEVLAVEPDALLLVTGDLNDFPFAEPSEGPDHPLGILEGLGDAVPLRNVILDLDRPYTFIFEGNSQVLDHVLLSPALLARLRDASIVHGFADTPAGERRASDHDAVSVTLALP